MTAFYCKISSVGYEFNKHNTGLRPLAEHILSCSYSGQLQYTLCQNTKCARFRHNLLFTNNIPLIEKRITAEVCVHHLHFTSDDYDKYGYLIKCNPAIKEGDNKLALWKGLLDNRLDVIATDHAPHTLEEKEGPYEHAHSGLPLIQHPLLIMLEYYKQGRISLERIVEKMSHAVAECFKIKERGYIREGYFADLVMLDLNKSTKVTKESLLYKCNWSPFEGTTFPGKILKTFINGTIVYNNEENNIVWNESQNGKRLIFNK